MSPMRTIRAARDGTGDSATLGGALELADALPPGPVRVEMAEGEYREKVKATRPGLSIVGAGADRTFLRWDDSASRPLADGERMGTFNSYTLYLGAPGIRVQGLTIENDAGDGRVVGQAVALYADADRISVYRCAILGRQDSLFTGPLPKDPVPKGVNLVHPVAGLGDDEPRLPFRQGYRECLVAGDVDFIFGSALAVFEGCEIRSLPRGTEASYIAAPSTYPGQEAGFVFSRCRLTGPGCPPGSVYLARPWRDHARAAFLDCELGSHIAGSGWDDWGKASAREASFFAERGSTGPGERRAGRASWARELTEAQAASLAPERLLWPGAF
jgi:pectinesterase